MANKETFMVSTKLAIIGNWLKSIKYFEERAIADISDFITPITIVQIIISTYGWQNEMCCFSFFVNRCIAPINNKLPIRGRMHRAKTKCDIRFASLLHLRRL